MYIGRYCRIFWWLSWKNVPIGFSVAGLWWCCGAATRYVEQSIKRWNQLPNTSSTALGSASSKQSSDNNTLEVLEAYVFLCWGPLCVKLIIISISFISSNEHKIRYNPGARYFFACNSTYFFHTQHLNSSSTSKTFVPAPSLRWVASLSRASVPAHTKYPSYEKWTVDWDTIISEACGGRWLTEIFAW